jgi:hypothetical protein
MGDYWDPYLWLEKIADRLRAAGEREIYVERGKQIASACFTLLQQGMFTIRDDSNAFGYGDILRSVKGTPRFRGESARKILSRSIGEQYRVWRRGGGVVHTYYIFKGDFELPRHISRLFALPHDDVDDGRTLYIEELFSRFCFFLGWTHHKAVKDEHQRYGVFLWDFISDIRHQTFSLLSVLAPPEEPAKRRILKIDVERLRDKIKILEDSLLKFRDTGDVSHEVMNKLISEIRMHLGMLRKHL